MTTSDEFVKTFREAVGARWRRPHSPGELADVWEQMVVACEEGYEGSIYEFENDMSVRELIDMLLADSRLSSFPQMAWFRESVEKADDRFKPLLHPARARNEKWWESSVLRYAGAELADDMMSTYGLHVAKDTTPSS